MIGGEAWASVIAYSLSSGSMLLVNKMALVHFPLPSVLSSVQLLFTALVSLALVRNKITSMSYSKTKTYGMYCLAFVASIYSNMRALQYSNVETIVVFRACAPMAIAWLDYFFLERELPSRRSIGALTLLCTGAIGYVANDAAFNLRGVEAYSWVGLYFLLVCFQMTYGKQISNNVSVGSPWESVLYTNVMSLPLMLLLGLLSGESAHSLRDVPTSTDAAKWPLVLGSCLVGTSINYTGWWCRSQLSATSYALVGVVNKVLAIIANLLIWDQHAGPAGLFYLLVCLVGGAVYQQAPMVKKPGDERGPEDASKEVHPQEDGHHRLNARGRAAVEKTEQKQGS